MTGAAAPPAPGAGLVIGGARVPVPGVNVVSWLDDPRSAPKVTDGRARTLRPISIVLHTSRGVRGTVRPGSLASSRAEVLALYQARTAREVSWHLTIDSDGDVLQQADIRDWSCWHAPPTNAWSIGIELVQQESSGDLYEVQIAAAVAVVEVLCSVLQIPRRVPVTAQGAPFAGVVPSWRSVAAGGKAEHWSGVLGHRNVTTDRGPGDPGDEIFRALIAAGFEGAVVGAATATATPAATHPTPPAPPSVAFTPPPWVDLWQEIVDTSDRTIAPEVFTRAVFTDLRALGLDVTRAVEVTAHCTTECASGKRAIGDNCGGIKLREDDNAQHRAKHGVGLPWWRYAGHVESGDAPVVLYRGFADLAECLRFWLKRYVPEDGLSVDRYAKTGAAFWGEHPERWFVELILAGYRGETRKREAVALLAAGGDGSAHPSVVAHRDRVRHVRAMVGA